MHPWLAVLLTGAVSSPQPENLRWALVDVAAGRVYNVDDDAGKVRTGGSLSAQPDGAGLRFEATYVADAVRVRLHDLTGRDRGLVVRLSLRLPPGTWRWWDDLDTAVPLGEQPKSVTKGLRELPGLPEFGEAERPDYGQYSSYPAGVVQSDGGWLGLARPMDQLALVRFSAVGGAEPRLMAEVDLAISQHGRSPGEASFALRCLSGDGPRGLRAAMAAVLPPEAQEVRVKRFGGWMPFTDLARLPNVDEFGFAYQEGAPNAAFDDALGADSFVYFHCAGEFANVPGYQRGTQPLPPYEDIVKAFNQVAQRHSGVADAWDSCGIRTPDQKIAFRPERTYGDFFCQACVDPDLPYGKAMADRLLERVVKSPAPSGIDGVYYDGIAAGVDYAPEHLAAADHLLLWDGKLKRAVNYNLFSSAEWCRYIHEKLAGTGKLTMLNDSSLVSFTFVGPWIDVPGGEMSIYLSRDQARLIRSLVGRKPFCTLVKADFDQVPQALMETYMRRCVAYGILFGYFDISPSGDHPGSSYWLHPEWYDRDRPLFRRYMPPARELAAAGWQPDPLATAAGACVERFGGETIYLTVSTDPGEAAPRPVTLALDPALRRPGQVAVELLTGRVARVDDRLDMTLGPDDLAVWAIATPARQAADAAARAVDVLDRLQGYRAAASLGAAGLAPWAPYGANPTAIDRPGHDSRHAVRIERRDVKEAAGVTQTYVANQKEPRPLVISAWCRAENVTGAKDSSFALYVDCYYAEGGASYGNVVTFDTGSHDWQYGEAVIKPEKAIRTVSLYLMMRGAHTGTAWFDDVRLADQGAPDVNLIKRGGFEPEQDRPMTSDPELTTLLRELRDGFAAGMAGKPMANLSGGLDRLEKLARDRAWPAESDRLLRDLADLRWHLHLAGSVAAPGGPRRESRLTEFMPLVAPKVRTGPRQYRANVGKVPQGTQITVDGSFDGYTPMVLTDGAINPEGAHWTKQAWASNEGGSHFVELRFPQPVKPRLLRLWWARDAGQVHASRKFEVQVRSGDQWVTMPGQQIQPPTRPELTEIVLTGGPVPALRLFQLDGGGSTERPGLLWLSELELVSE